MTLDLMGACAITVSAPGGLVTSGASASIARAMLAYRETNSTTTERT